MPQKKVPMRMCTGCGEMKPKRELIRVVHGADGSVTLDHTGKKAGRGAYICKNPDCLKKAAKAKRLERAFSCQIPPEVYAALQEELKSSG